MKTNRSSQEKMPIKLDSGFEIFLFSDVIGEELTVEIEYQGEAIANINKQGKNQEIEIRTDYLDCNFQPKFILDDFLLALNQAQKLIESYQ